jgi:hypothetical protein
MDTMLRSIELTVYAAISKRTTRRSRRRASLS